MNNCHFSALTRSLQAKLQLLHVDRLSENNFLKLRGFRLHFVDRHFNWAQLHYLTVFHGDPLQNVRETVLRWRNKINYKFSPKYNRRQTEVLRKIGRSQKSKSFKLTSQNSSALPLIFDEIAASPSRLRERRLEHESVNVMVLFELRLSSLQFIFDEVWHDMGDLNVSHFWIKIVHDHLLKIFVD